MKDSKRDEILIGSLLHDIGRFFQRVNEDYQNSPGISEQAKGIADFICPADQKGRFKPNTTLQRLIQLSDWWSSGLDRSKSYLNMTSNVYSDFRDEGLQPVFSYVNLEGGPKTSKDCRVKIQPLQLDETIFPAFSDDETGDYESLWNGFISELDNIPANPGEKGVEAFTETLLFLLKKYLSVLPASTIKGEMPGTTLYDHLKSTAALSQSLFDYFFEKDSKRLTETDFHPKDYFDLSKNPNVEPPLLLFCGSINGIQRFIYNIASSKAAKILKGRSFYVQLLAETIIRRIIDDCKVSLAHIIYASGGKFFMILPNTDTVKLALQALKAEVENKLFDIHHGDLYVCMDFVEFGYDNQINVFFKDDQNDSGSLLSQSGNLGPVWKILNDKINIQKKKKFKDLLIERYDQFFSPDKSTSGTSLVCSVTGVDLKNEQARRLTRFGDDDMIVSQTVFEQIKIGHLLKTADFLVTFREIGDKSSEAWREKSIQPLNLKVYHYFFDESELTGGQSQFKFISAVDVARVRRLNNTRLDQRYKLKRDLTSHGFSLYGGNIQAMKPDCLEFKNFEELAGKAENGFRRLGILRMDVDNLGRLFIEGIPEDQKNLSFYSTLSNQLDLFFSGYINTIRNSEKFRNYVNIIYSGGDDVFAVGRWDHIIDFAETVRDDFRKFVCNKNKISITAGITLVGIKFPLSKAAQMAGEAVAKAKQFGLNKLLKNAATKNAINIFGENVEWGQEFSFIKSLSFELHRWLVEEKITKSMLQHFYIFRKIKDSGRQDWRWLSAYTFARHQKSETTAKIEMEKLKTLMIAGSFDDMKLESGATCSFKFDTSRALDLLCIAAKWADFRTRE